MKFLIQEYRVTLKLVEKARDNAAEPSERAILGSMMRDLQYAIRWMKSGREPGSNRGVERLAVYQRESPYDPMWFEREEYCRRPLYPPVKELSEPRRFELERILDILSPREKEIYKLSRGEGFTFEEIGEMLGITKGTINKTVSRAEEKIKKVIDGLSDIG